MNNNFEILLVGTVAMLTLILIIIFFTSVYQKRIKQKEINIKATQDLLKKEELRATYALLEGQDKERIRIAQDLHDGLGGQLSVINIYTDLLNKTTLTQEQKELVSKQSIALKGAITDLRQISHNLSNSVLNNFGLEKAVESVCEKLNNTKKINVNWYTSFEVEPKVEVAKVIYQNNTRNIKQYHKACKCQKS
jgi:Signal transduction histidine kinase